MTQSSTGPLLHRPVQLRAGAAVRGPLEGLAPLDGHRMLIHSGGGPDGDGVGASVTVVYDQVVGGSGPGAASPPPEDLRGLVQQFGACVRRSGAGIDIACLAFAKGASGRVPLIITCR